MRSTPGICSLQHYGSTNGQILGWDGTSMDPERVQLLKSAVRCRFNDLRRGEAVADPIKVFVKPEPHSVKKLAEGRYRIISAVSLVDTMVDRILFGWMARKALSTVGMTPCMLGWSPLRGAWRDLKRFYAGSPVICTDKSGFDWSVQGYMVDLWLRFVKDLAKCHEQWWSDMVDLRFRLLFEDAVFQFPDGSQAKQQTKGIMKSGCFLTLILNSVAQSLAHYIAMYRMGYHTTLRQPHAMGDDTVQKPPPELEKYLEILTSLGFQIKGGKVQDWIEFCGFSYYSTCTPSYWDKHLFNLQYGDLRSKLGSYQVLYANEPEMFRFLERVAVQVDPGLALSEGIAKSIMNG